MAELAEKEDNKFRGWAIAIGFVAGIILSALLFFTKDFEGKITKIWAKTTIDVYESKLVEYKERNNSVQIPQNAIIAQRDDNITVYRLLEWVNEEQIFVKSRGLDGDDFVEFPPQKNDKKRELSRKNTFYITITNPNAWVLASKDIPINRTTWAKLKLGQPAKITDKKLIVDKLTIQPEKE
jgi:hypothetical protein